jgi:hypothetical protein
MVVRLLSAILIACAAGCDAQDRPIDGEPEGTTTPLASAGVILGRHDEHAA